MRTICEKNSKKISKKFQAKTQSVRICVRTRCEKKERILCEKKRGKTNVRFLREKNVRKKCEKFP